MTTPDHLVQAVERLEEARTHPTSRWSSGKLETCVDVVDLRLVLSTLTRLTAERDAAVGGLARPGAKAKIEEALASTWHAYGGWNAVQSGLVNMTGLMADAVLAALSQLSAHGGLREIGREQSARTAIESIARAILSELPAHSAQEGA